MLEVTDNLVSKSRCGGGGGGGGLNNGEIRNTVADKHYIAFTVKSGEAMLISQLRIFKITATFV